MKTDNEHCDDSTQVCNLLRNLTDEPAEAIAVLIFSLGRVSARLLLPTANCEDAYDIAFNNACIDLFQLGFKSEQQSIAEYEQCQQRTQAD